MFRYPLKNDQKPSIDWNLAKVATLVIMALVMGSIACILFTSCSTINQKMGQQDDWIGEELVEAILETGVQYETGYRPNFDLTPSSPEK